MDTVIFNRYWKRIIDTMNDALMVISKQGLILTVNRSFIDMTGYQPEEVVGKPCTLLECDACEKAINSDGSHWCQLFEPGHQTIRRCRCHILKKDGTYLSALKNASVLCDDDGSVIGSVETLTDISEIDRLDKKVALLSRKLDGSQGFGNIIGACDAMKRVYDIIEKAAKSEAPIVIYGESGTGKELVAQAIHERGHRGTGPYVQLNCAALNEALLESELFGHIKGAYTGAYRDRRGRFEAAHGGDLFLDEIGDIPLSIQIKLLRVLETQQFERVGDNQSVSVDVRIITATNKNLIELISKGTFREDLFFRINVIPIHLPPLRERREDIPLLVNTFMDRLSVRTGKSIHGLTREALDRFLAYNWPGNVREMKSALEYAFTIADKELIDCEHLPPHLCGRGPAERSRPLELKTKAHRQKKELLAALEQAGGNQTLAARLLGVNRVTVWNRMRKYGLNLKKQVRPQSEAT